MTRGFAYLLQAIDDTIGVPMFVLALFIGAIVFGVLHYFYPRWVPQRFPSLRRRGKKASAPGQEDVPAELLPEDPGTADELPDLPAHVFASLADRLAAEGRYAEAVRERLRAIVRGLVERRSVEVLPGMTVTEVARAAAVVVPAVEPPLRGATAVFSDIWYGQQPATIEHDNRMRRYAAEVDA